MNGAHKESCLRKVIKRMLFPDGSFECFAISIFIFESIKFRTQYVVNFSFLMLFLYLSPREREKKKGV